MAITSRSIKPRIGLSFLFDYLLHFLCFLRLFSFLLGLLVNGFKLLSSFRNYESRVRLDLLSWHRFLYSYLFVLVVLFVATNTKMIISNRLLLGVLVIFVIDFFPFIRFAIPATTIIFAIFTISLTVSICVPVLSFEFLSLVSFFDIFQNLLLLLGMQSSFFLKSQRVLLSLFL